eukprot:gene6479-7756_t
MITPEQHATLHVELKNGGKNGNSNNSSNGNGSNGSSSRTAAPAPRQTSASMRASSMNSTNIANSITVEDSPTTSADEKEVVSTSRQSSGTVDTSKHTSSTSQQDTTVAPLRSSLSSLHLLSALSSHNNSNHSSNAHAQAHAVVA